MSERKRDYKKEMQELMQKMQEIAADAFEEDKVQMIKDFKKLISRLVIQELVQRSSVKEIDNILGVVRKVFNEGIKMSDNEVRELGILEEEMIEETRSVILKVLDEAFSEVKKQLLRIYANG